MKKAMVLILSLFFVITIAAGSDISRHSLSMNLGGPGALATFEYQYQIHSGKKTSFSLTAGTGNALLMFSFPLGFNYTYGDKNQLLVGAHFVPLAINSDLFGGFLADEPSDSWSFVYAFSPRFGYRRMIEGINNNSYFHVYFAPLFGLQGGFFPSAGIGLGVYL